MNTHIKNKVAEVYRKEIQDRLAQKGMKVSDTKLNRMVEASLVRKKYLDAGAKIEVYGNSRLKESLSTPQNTAGRGTFSFGNDPSNASDHSRGSGEVFDQLFGLFVDAYASTVGFDILHTKQMTKSNLMVSILEPIYTGGRIKGTDATSSLLTVFTVKLEATGAVVPLVIGTTYTIEDGFGGNTLATVIYTGFDRGTGHATFRLVSVDASVTADDLNTILDTAVTGAGIYTSALIFYGFESQSVGYLNANTNHLTGFTAAGADDTQNWTTQGHNGQTLYRGNTREVGETRDFRTMGFNKWSRNFSAGTHKVKIAFTKEMFQDMMMEEGVNLHDMADLIGTEELSQAINQEILTNVFAQGWGHHKAINNATGFNGNLHLDTAVLAGGSTYVDQYGVSTQIASTPAGLATGFTHNIGTAQRLLVTRIGFMASVIGNKSRMGKGDTCVTGSANSSAISDIRGFREQPFENNLTDNEDVSFVGTFKRIGLYEDTTMDVSDRRVSVSKKGDDKTSGLALCNYILADKVGTVAEQTGEEVSFLYSRMVIAEKGSNPSLMYLTFDVTGKAIV